jgi:hypothetical protein
MSKSTQRKRSAQGVLIPRLNLLDIIDRGLKDMQRTWPNKELLTEEIQHWHADLGPFTAQAIEYAFECWRRNGHFFPVYGDIIDLCIAFEPISTTRRGCSIECRERHGKGYNENDVAKLFKLYETRMSQLSRPMTDAEIDKLLDDLDKWRGKHPEWRAA